MNFPAPMVPVRGWDADAPFACLANHPADYPPTVRRCTRERGHEGPHRHRVGDKAWDEWGTA